MGLMTKKEAVPGYAKKYSNHKVMIVQGDTISFKAVYSIDADTIETADGVLLLIDCEKYFDETNGAFTYVFNLDIPAKVESANLKKLRRSSAVANIFKYQVHKPFDIIKFMPWVAMILLILFK